MCDVIPKVAVQKLLLEHAEMAVFTSIWSEYLMSRSFDPIVKVL